MKPKTAWLALPFLLAALMLGVKWRAEHPTPTKEDLEIRASMSKCSVIEFEHHPNPRNARDTSFNVKLSEQEMKPLIECFFTSPEPLDVSYLVPVSYEEFHFYTNNYKRRYGTEQWSVSMFSDGRSGALSTNRTLESTKFLTNVYPVTIKRWAEFLRDHSRIGPQLRATTK